MRILFLTRLFYPHTGGVERHIEFLSKELIEKGHEVVVFTGKHDNGLPDEEKIKRVQVKRISYPEIKFLGLFVIWLKLIKNVKYFLKTDVIHIHDVFVWYLPLRFLLPFKKVFISHHGWEGEYPIPKKNKIYKKIATNLSSGSISVGDFINRHYEIKTDFVTYGAAKPPQKISKKKKNSIVYVGRLSGDTGLPFLLEVLDKLKNYNIEFLGEGSLQDECKKYGKVHGFVKNPQEYMAKAEICFASGYLTILEAMANKCLVVTAYDNKLKKDYYEKAPFSKWIISGNDASKLQRKINSFTHDNEMREQILNKAYNWAKKQTWQDLSEQYLSLWNKK